jgi:hypothetical protein
MPDLIPFGVPEGGLVQAKNLIPYDDKYGKAQDKQTYSTSAASDTAKNGTEMRTVGAAWWGFFGTASKIYRIKASDKSITAKGTGYTTGDNMWSFAQYGDTALATNYTDAVQKFVDFAGAGTFGALGGSPPKAKYMLFYRGHLILAFVNDGTAYPKKIQWSGLEAIESWTASLITGADSQSFPDGQGDITGIASMGDLFGVFHESSISVGYYSGAPYTFTFRHNAIKNIGCYVPGSLISIGPAALFWGEDDIYSYDGNQLIPLGYGVKETILDNLNLSKVDRVTAAHDPLSGIVYWSYPVGSVSTPNRVLAYNYRAKKFTNIELTMECIFRLHTGGLDMDSIDSLYPDIDDMPYHMDSRDYQSGTVKMACVDTDNYVDTIDGMDLTGTLETGEVKDEDNVLMVDRVRPRIDSAREDVKVRVGSRFDENDAVGYTSLTTVGNNGYADLRSTGRYHRIELTTTDHDGIQDLEVRAKKAGER